MQVLSESDLYATCVVARHPELRNRIAVSRDVITGSSPAALANAKRSKSRTDQDELNLSNRTIHPRHIAVTLPRLRRESRS